MWRLKGKKVLKKYKYHKIVEGDKEMHPKIVSPNSKKKLKSLSIFIKHDN